MPVLVRHRLRRNPVKLSAFSRFAQRILDLLREPQAELSLELIGSQRMRRLNREFRGKDRPTDVLAFPMREAPHSRPDVIGDVVIAMPVAMAQARCYHHSLDEELIRLLVHGVLHLLGYDHERGEREARKMRSKESLLLNGLKPFPKLSRFAKARKSRNVNRGTRQGGINER